MTIQKAFENFAYGGDFEAAVDSSTIASWEGRCYLVELFDDGTYRVLWSGQLGNNYEGEGLILRIPALSDAEWDDDETLRFYDNALDSFSTKFEEILSYSETN